MHSLHSASRWAVHCERCRRPIVLPASWYSSIEAESDEHTPPEAERLPRSVTLRCRSCLRERVYVRSNFFEMKLAAHAAAG